MLAAMSSERLLQLLNALIGTGIGIFCLVWAKAAATSLGISLAHPTGLTDFRATYGGITLACGAFFALAFFGVVDAKAGLWFSVLFYAGLGIVRLAGVLIDGPQKPMMYGFLVCEILLLIWSAVLLKGTA
jgi:hypothetical protein